MALTGILPACFYDLCGLNGIKNREKELGLFIAGGKGKTSLRTPREIETASSKFALGYHVKRLQETSRLVAKVDNTALQDGYNLYHHCIFFTKEGDWSVVQQGMNENTRWARRYHWLGKEWAKIKEHEVSLDLPRHHPLPQGKGLQLYISLFKTA